MIRTAIWFSGLWGYMFVLVPAYYKVKGLKKKGLEKEADDYAYTIAQTWARRLIKLSGSRVTTHFEAPLPEAPFLIVANHQGNFDIPLIMGHVSSRVGFLSKVENGRLPLVGAWMRLIHCVFIERGNPREAVKAIQEGVDTLKAGHSLVLFPEGTRSRTGELQPFKSGSLRLAAKGGVPVVPVVINGSVNMMKKGSLIIHPADVHITVGAPLKPEAFETTKSLTDALEGYIGGVLEEAKAKS